MTCGHCGAANEPDDHRCERCGRRLGVDPSGGASYFRTQGSQALAVEPRPQPVAEVPAPPPRMARQAELFGSGRRVVSIDGSPLMRAKNGSNSKPLDTASVVGLHQMQQALDFAPVRKGIHTTSATRHAKAPVAEPARRLIAGAIDFGVCAIVVGVVALILWGTIGHDFLGAYTKHFYAAVALTIGAAYKLLFVAAEMDSPGLRWCGLRLLDFDGQIPGRAQRVRRFLWALVSALPGGLGLVWSFVEADHFTWHDISTNTFLSPVSYRTR